MGLASFSTSHKIVTILHISERKTYDSGVLPEYLSKNPDFPESFVKVHICKLCMAEQRKIHENRFLKKEK